jgi:regulator of sigma E protease
MTLIYFVLILGITVFIHEFGHFIMAKKNGVYCYEFSIGMGPKIYSFTRKNDETTYSIRLFPIGGFVQMAGEDIEEEDIPKNKQMQSKTIWQRIVIVLAGIFNNFVLGFVLLFLMALIYGSTSLKPIVTNVDSKYNAYKVNVREGDTILKVNGKKTKTLDDVILEITLTKQGDAIKLDLVDKDGNNKSVSVLPTKVENEDGSESYIYGLGWGNDKTEKGLISSFKYAISKFSSLFRSMGKIICSLFTGKLGLDSLSGPVGIYKVVGEQRKAGFENIIYLTAYISINVGFVNLIPFPAFDGGRALFLIIEKIRKKPVKKEVENTIHSVGFVLLMILVVVITIKDVIKLF